MYVCIRIRHTYSLRVSLLSLISKCKIKLTINYIADSNCCSFSTYNLTGKLDDHRLLEKLRIGPSLCCQMATIECDGSANGHKWKLGVRPFMQCVNIRDYNIYDLITFHPQFKL